MKDIQKSLIGGGNLTTRRHNYQKARIRRKSKLLSKIKWYGAVLLIIGVVCVLVENNVIENPLSNMKATATPDNNRIIEDVTEQGNTDDIDLAIHKKGDSLEIKW